VSGQADTYVRDRVAGTTVRACPGFERAGPSIAPSISADGTAVPCRDGYGAGPKAAQQLLQSTCASANPGRDRGERQRRRKLGNRTAFYRRSTGMGSRGLQVQRRTIWCRTHHGFVTSSRAPAAGIHGAHQRVVPGRELRRPFPSAASTTRALSSPSAPARPRAQRLQPGVDVFVRDRRAASRSWRRQRASASRQRRQPDDPPSLSGDGKALAYASTGDDLVPADTTPSWTSSWARIRSPANAEDCPQGFTCSTASARCWGTRRPRRRPAPNDCCQCAGPAVSAGQWYRVPERVPPVYDALCEVGRRGVTFTPTKTPTPTPTPGPTIAAVALGPACQAPGSGTGWSERVPTGLQRICEVGRPCVTSHPTPRRRRPNDCCQCAGRPVRRRAVVPVAERVPPVYNALCEDGRRA